MEGVCAVCGESLPGDQLFAERGSVQYWCETCGELSIARDTFNKLPAILGEDENKRSLLSFSLRKMQKKDQAINVTTGLVTNILKGQLPKPAEQADNLILWLGNELKGPGEKISVSADSHKSLIGAKSDPGFMFILKTLYEKKLIETEASIGQGVRSAGDITLTMDGWIYYEELLRSKPQQRKAFMAMQFGNKELLRIVDKVFKPAVSKTGFNLELLTDNQRAGLIDDRLRVEIRTCRFLIADLSHDNPGAYWEAGYAEGLSKPVIYTCKENKFKKNKTHFDTNHHLTVRWSTQKIDRAAEELKAIIRATLPAEAILSDN